MVFFISKFALETDTGLWLPPTHRLALADERLCIDPERSKMYLDGAELTECPRHVTDLIGVLAMVPDQYHHVESIALQLHGDAGSKAIDYTRKSLSLGKKILSSVGLDGDEVLVSRYKYGYSGSTSVVNPTHPVVNPHGITSYCADQRIGVDQRTAIVSVDDKELLLSAAYFGIINQLVTHVDTAIPASSLMAVNGLKPGNTLAVMIQTLRTHFGPELGDRAKGAIRSARGIGYFAVSRL